MSGVILFVASDQSLADDADVRETIERTARALRVAEFVMHGGISIDAEGTRDLAARWQGLQFQLPEATPLRTRLAIDMPSGVVTFETEGRVNADAEEHLRFVFRPGVDTLLIDHLNARSFGIGPDGQAQAERYRLTVPQYLLRALLDRSPSAPTLSFASQAADGRSADIAIQASWRDGRAVTVHLDPAGGGVRAVSTNVDLPVDGPSTLTWSYGPYEAIDGFLLPTGHTVSVGGRVLESLRYRRITLRGPGPQDLVPAAWITTPAPPAPERVTAPPSNSSPSIAPPGPAVSPLREIRPGVYVFRNARGGFHPLVIDQSDGLLVVDAPAGWHELAELPPSQSESDAGSGAVGERLLTELEDLFPGRPVRRLVLTHHHGDHIGGALPFVDAGVEIFATTATRDALETLLRHHSRAPDSARVRIVKGRLRIGDAIRPVDLIDVGSNPHSVGMLVVHLPEERILYQSDLFEPASAARFPARERLPVMQWFVRWLDQSGLVVDEVVAIHGSARVTAEQLDAVRSGAAVKTKVAVVGATGVQGGAVARELLSRDIAVRSLTRNPDGPRARVLAESGAEIVRADLNDGESLRVAFAGVHAVFAMTDFWEHGREREVAHGRNLVAAARAAGVRHLVFSSVASADRSTGLPHFESKYEIEGAIRDSGLPFTILRPVSFMENWSDVRRDLADGWWIDPQSPASRQQLISVRDLARFAADAIERPEAWLGVTVDLAGDELTIADMIAVTSRVLGMEVRHRQISWRDAQRDSGDEATAMLRWFERVGYDVDVPALRAAYPWMMRFEDFLAGLPVSKSDSAAEASAPGVVSIVDRMSTSMGRPNAANRAVQLEWLGTGVQAFDSYRPDPPWDVGRRWEGRILDFGGNTAMTKQVATGNGTHSITGTRLSPDGSVLAFDARVGTVRPLLSGSIDAVLEDNAPYSPVFALAVLQRHPERVSRGADRTCRGRRLHTVTYQRSDGRELHLLVDPATHRVSCVHYDHIDYDGSLVPLRVEHDESWLANPGLEHPTGYAEYARDILIRRMELVHLDASARSLEDGPPPGDFLAVAPEMQGLRDFGIRELAPGVWLVGEGVMYQLFVEVDDFLVAVDGSSGDVERRIRAVSERVPGKSLRYLVVTHSHADHLHGVRAFAQRGATVLASEGHVAAVRRHLGEGLSTRVESVKSRFVIQGRNRDVEVLDFGPTPHSEHHLAAYLPAEQLLYESDLMVISRWDPVPPASGNMRALDAAIARLRLDVEHIAGPHTPVVATRGQLTESVARAAAQSMPLSMPFDDRWRTDPSASW